MGNSKKLMLIGWDAADWKVIHQLIEEGQLPTLKAVMEKGTMGNLRTLSPVLSPMLWTSIATGKRPYKHGIYGFTEPTPNGKSVQAMGNLSRRCKAIWNILNQHDLTSQVVCWWPSHPAEPIDGVMVSDFFHKVPKKPGDPWPLMAKCVHPEEKLKELAKLRIHPRQMTADIVRPFVPLGHEIDQDADSRLAMCMRMISECTTVHDTAEHLLDNEEWDFAAIYYDAIDHFCHGFMRYRAPQRAHITDKDFRIYKDVVTNAYRFHDLLLKKLIAKGADDTTFILMSDHGFHPDHLRPTSLPSEPAGPALEHRDYGIFLAWGPNIRRDHIIHSASLLDITPTILSVFGLPIGEDMDGKPLLGMFEDAPKVDTIPSWEDVAGNDGRHPQDMAIEAADSQAALDQLVALGYIEAPDSDMSQAVRDCQRELDYNLARSYIDAGMHGEATPLLLDLYKNYPLEFRFGIQLATCLRAMNRVSALEKLIEHMNANWRVAASEARGLLKEIEGIKRERLVHWNELKKIEEESDDPNVVKLARLDTTGKPAVFDETEKRRTSKIRSVAQGNAQTLDFLAASVASSKGEFEKALDMLEKAQITKSKNPGFQFHVGIVYLGLERFDDAEAAFLKALEFDEFHPNALMGLCRTYVEKGQWQKAIDFGKQATGLKFHFPVAHYFLGRSKNKIGDFNGAITSLSTAVKQNPNFVEVHELLAKIYRKSVLDEDLAKFHKSTAEELSRQNESIRQNDSFDLPEFRAEQFRADLPKLDEMETNADFVRPLSQAKAIFGIEKATAKDAGVPEVIIVSGLPRSGTSMMMQMLKAGGVDVFTDSERTPDESNIKGYFEAEIVKKLGKENKWVHDCDGQVIKVVAPLIPSLPQGVNYKVIFMNRDMGEILNSQTSMLERLQKDGGNIEQERLGEIYQNQIHVAIHLLKVHGQSIFVANYHEIVENPGPAAKQIAKYLERDLDEEAMCKAVSPELYREKK